jgi:type I restriction enzyme S subunit
MTAETFFTNFGHLADAPNGVNKLRELILQLAVQGKLVPQDPEDEPASVLLEKIKAERLGWVKEKRIRNSKPLPKIELNDHLFHIPKNWIWTRLGEYGDWGAGATPSRQKSSYYGGSMPWLKSGELNDSFVSESVETITELALKECSLRIDKPGDVLIAMYGATIGKVAILEIEATTNQAVCACTCLSGIYNHFLFLLLKAYLPFFTGQGAGGAQPNISREKIIATPVPLPPLAEQKRIVAKVDQLMTLCNELEARKQKQQQGRVRLNNSALNALLTAREPDEFADHWQRISTNFDLLYDHPEPIAKLRAAILQLAVQGKLVPQDPNDEPASVLLERIKAEKERLVKEGKLKKQKPLPIINEDLAPFTLPNGWSWASFPNVGEFGRGKSKHRPRNDRSLYVGGTYPMVQTGDVARANGEIKTYTALYNDVGLAQSRLWPKGTMCITIAANIADSSILGFDACFPDSVVGLIVSKQISNVRYFEYFMRTAKEHLMDFAPSTAQKNINLGILETVLIPLPPLAEIDRIVAKADQLMALCDELEAKLNQAQQHSEKLMEATVRQLLGTSTPQKPHTSRAPAAPAAGKSVRPARHAYQPAPAIAEPIAAETAVVYGGSVPETILAAMQPGQEYSRADILAATSIREADWMWAIKQLKEQRRVAQSGEKRGARYRLK